MKLSHFTQALGSNPRSSELVEAAKLLTKSGENVDAERALASALLFEQRIERAFEILPPELLEAQLLAISKQTRSRSRWQPIRRKISLAAAASLTACAIFAGAWLWSNETAIEAKLAADCVEHLSHEPFSLSRTTRVPPALVGQLFAKHGLKIDNDIVVNYLQPCVVNGRSTLHIVMQQPSGPVTVMIFTMASPIGDLERSLDKATVRVRGFDGGGLVFIAESSRDFDIVEAKMRARVLVQRIQVNG